MQYIDLIKNYENFDIEDARLKLKLLEYIEKKMNLLDRSEDIHLTSSGWVFNEDFTKVLLVYHNNSWFWPGGHVDGNPNLADVSKEEVIGETGVNSLSLVSSRIFQLDFHSVIPHVHRIYGEVPAHTHINSTFIFQADEHSTLKAKVDEVAKTGWFGVRDIETVATKDSMKEVAQKLVRRIDAGYFDYFINK